MISQIPGKILKVSVKAGDTVTVGQPLFLIEAMKMEIDIYSDEAGTVKEVCVKDGDTIDIGQNLIIVG